MYPRPDRFHIYIWEKMIETGRKWVRRRGEREKKKRCQSEDEGSGKPAGWKINQRFNSRNVG